MNKEEFTAYITRNASSEFNMADIDRYFTFFINVPLNGSAYYVGDEYHLARDLFEWNLICQKIEPIISGNLYKGRKIFYYRNF